MKSWLYLAPFACASLILVAAQACSGSETEPSAPLTEEVAQHADGCGALRYRGSGNITCDYRAHRVQNGQPTASGQCSASKNSVICTYGLSCAFQLVEASGGCVEGASDICWSQYPPEASTPVPQTVYTWPLMRGNKLCDPPPGQQVDPIAVNNFCANNWYTPWQEAEEYCRDINSRNSGSATCCRDCPSPLPPTGGPPACYPPPDGGVGFDAPPPDGGLAMDAGPRDAGIRHDASAPPPPPPPPPGGGSGSGSGSGVH